MLLVCFEGYPQGSEPPMRFFVNAPLNELFLIYDLKKMVKQFHKKRLWPQNTVSVFLLSTSYGFNFHFQSDRFDAQSSIYKVGSQVGKSAKNDSLLTCTACIVFMKEDFDEPLLYMKYVKIFHSSNLDLLPPEP